MAADTVNSTAVRVTWTRLNEPVVDHYTVHYSRVNGGSGRRRRRQVDSERTVTFPASASSGVVSGLQEGQQYQFSVSVTLIIGGQTYTGTPGGSITAMTGVLMLLHMTRFPRVQSDLFVIVDSCTHKIKSQQQMVIIKQKTSVHACVTM